MSYKITLNNLGRNYEAKGATISEAITSFKLGKIVGRTILTVENGDGKKVERIIAPLIAKRAFNGAGMMREVAIKNLSLMFTGV